MSKADVISEFALNKTQVDKLDFYLSCITKHNQHTNLVGKSTIENIWDRHVLDCLQLTKYITNKKSKILDLGTGSGCILLSILKEKPELYGKGIDISGKSIELCRANAKKLGITNKVDFTKTDVDNFCFGKYDLVISNPPYIKSNEIKYLEKDVNHFEPRLALDGGLDGTLKILKIIEKASSLLKVNGKLVLEIAHNQKTKVIGILKQKGFYINKTIRDYAQNDRCIISTKIK